MHYCQRSIVAHSSCNLLMLLCTVTMQVTTAKLHCRKTQAVALG